IAALFLARGGVSALGTHRAPRYSASGSAPREAVTTARERHGAIVAMACDNDTLTPEDVRRFLAARALGDSLVLVIDGVESNNGAVETQRIDALEQALLALECVDEVVRAPRADFESLLRSLRPHVWVESADPRDGGRLDPQIAAAWGGQLVTLPYGERHVVDGLSRGRASAAGVPDTAAGRRPRPVPGMAQTANRERSLSEYAMASERITRRSVAKQATSAPGAGAQEAPADQSNDEKRGKSR
ncbi:MAG: hypothetical protein ACTHNX_15740, partial [Humibacter sp.]